MSAAEGSVIAHKYRLVSLLGRGGMGAVWRAQDLDLNAPVAVKLLDPLLAATAEGMTRFHREAEAAATLRSPHVVQILARGIDDATSQPFIVMELMEGESLAGRLVREGRLSAEQTVRIFSHIARALTRAHEAGIVHRDLKPDNVFLVPNDDEEIAKVLDFGIAKSEKHSLGKDSGTRTGAVMGTPYYMSPEQISSSKGVDFRADLWALGVIACECLTGQRPFDADTYGGLAVKICAEPLPRPSALGSVPAGFDAWFAQAVHRDPTARFGSAREAAEALRRACGVTGGPASAKAEVFSPAVDAQTASMASLSRTSRQDAAGGAPGRRRLGIVLAGATALAVIVVGVLAFLRAPSAVDTAPSPSTAALSPPTAAALPVPPTSLVATAAPPPLEPPSSPSVSPAPSATEPPAAASAGPASPARSPLRPASPKPPLVRKPTAPRPVAATAKATPPPASTAATTASKPAQPNAFGSAISDRE